VVVVTITITVDTLNVGIEGQAMLRPIGREKGR